MIHRDVKPDNLLLDEQGLVKVADLGLVKTPATHAAADDQPRTDGRQPAGCSTLPPDMTGARIALGTPAYMSPEQCRDAATVDHRADIYSLGCTLYVLVTGRPPFDGTTAVELMTKHAYEPLVPPEQIVARVPKEAVGGHPADDGEGRRTTASRHGRGDPHAGGVARRPPRRARSRRRRSRSPSSKATSLQFNTAPTAVLRGRLVDGFFGGGARSPPCCWRSSASSAGRSALVGLVVQAALAYFVIDGVARKGHLFTRVAAVRLRAGAGATGRSRRRGLGLFCAAAGDARTCSGSGPGSG